MEKRNDVVQLIAELVTRLDAREKQLVLGLLKRDGIPISAFHSTLSGLEIVVRYAKDVEKKSFKEIASLLNRKLPTIYTTYTHAKKKFPQPLDLSNSSIRIPVDIFSDRRYAVLELIVAYLKENEKLSLKEIAAALHKHYNTISTTYRRYKARGAP